MKHAPSGPFRDLRSPGVIVFKGTLFLLLGLAAGALAWLDRPTMRMAGLLTLTIWAFCRAYYFAFYVIEHYVDSQFHYSGLGSFLRWWLHRERRGDP